MTTATVPASNELQRGIRRRLTQVVIQIAVQAAILFWSAGTLRWGWAWVFLGLYVVMATVSGYLLLKRSPETIVERGRTAGNWKDWDKVVGLLFTLFYFVGMLLVAGLDRRHGWTDGMPIGWRLVGLGGWILGAVLFSWAMIENAFFSTTVRIQDDRGQSVCTTGPYRFVRHPGYLGIVIESLTQPLLLGSLWTLVPGVLSVLLLGVRTALEDRTLRAELPGYEAFTRQTRFRLIPGVW